MANDITVTKNTTSGSERWDVEYTADASGTVTKTMDTAETIMDRDIKVSVTIPSGSATTPATSVTANPSISVSSTGLITATTSATKSVTPTVSAGFVTAGTAGTITVSGSNTSQLTNRTSSDLEASGATVTAPAGYYNSAASKSVSSGSATTPATTVTANPTISVNSSTGVITATASATESVTPTVSAGYVSSGTAGTITVSGSNTSNLTTQAAQTIYPSTSDQTIASGKYLTGTQTVKGVLLTNLTAGNIKKDVVIKVGDSADDDRITSVTGTYEGGGGVTITDTLDSHGGTIRTIDATGASFWNYLGQNAELIATYDTQSILLSSTTYSSWTASTTAKSIKASTNAGTITADLTQYDYLLRWMFTFDAVFNTGATMNTIPVRQCSEIWQGVFRRAGSLANIANYSYPTSAAVTLYSTGVIDYYNSSGTHTMAHSNSYGFYPSVSAIGISSTSSNTPTLTMKRPACYVRCSTTYFDTSRYGDINGNSVYKIKGEVYRIAKQSNMMAQAQFNSYATYNNGI